MDGFKKARREMSPPLVGGYRLSEQQFVVREMVFETQPNAQDFEADQWKAFVVREQ